MTLLQRVQQLDGQRCAIVGDSRVSYAQLIQHALQLRQQYPALQHQPVTLSFTDLPQFCAALLAFDGWCSALYLLPDHDVALPTTVLHWPSTQAIAPITATTTTTTQWLLATSGTTGTPKWIQHHFASLSRAVKTTPASSALHWALCYQPCRFAGLQVLLQSLLSGSCIADVSSGTAEQRLALMQQYGVNAVSATPSLWRQLLMTGQLTQLSLLQLTLGGEIADQTLLDTLAKMFPAAKLLHIYASTEAGVGFAVADKQAGFPASWLTVGPSGLAFKIDERQHLWLKPAVVADVNLAQRMSSDGFLDSEDLVGVDNDRVLFLGRASGIINVGGNKVHPEQVEQVLLQHPAVRQARVYAKSSSVLGQLVVADIVTDCNEDTAALHRQLLQYCQQRLQRYQMPTRFSFVSELSTNATGKLNRHTNKQGAS